MPKSIPSYQDIYGSEYLNPLDLNKKKVRVVFTSAEVRELRCQEKTGIKIVLKAETEDGKPCKKLIAVNKTSAKQMSLAWGVPDTQNGCKAWLGKLAELSHTKVKAFGKLADCILITPIGAVERTPADHEEAPPDDLSLT